MEPEPIRNVLFLDALTMPLSLVGALLCLGTLTLPHSQYITVLTGLVLILVAKAQVVSLQFRIVNVTQAATVVWSYFFLVYGLFLIVAVLRALWVLLS